MTDIKYELYNNLVASPRQDDTYKILKEFTYKDVKVPVGYKTNGADVPRFLWSFFPPNRSTYLPAVVIHDYLCSIGEWRKANIYFNEILEILEVGKATHFSFKWGTHLYFKVSGKI